MPDFSKFKRKSAYRTRDPKVAIQASGNLSLNEAAIALLRREGEAEGDEIAVALLYDAKEQIIGIQRVGKDDPDRYVVRKQPNSASYLVAGRAFTKHFEIPVGKARRFNVKSYGEHTIGFSLKNESQAVGRTGGARDS